jgi:hypothetical protein
LKQHPPQLPALHPEHAPALHVCGVGHVWHWPPPWPHALSIVPATHWFPWQQPFGHVDASQMHCPPLHRWPVLHAALEPHVHSPLTQLSADVGLQG